MKKNIIVSLSGCIILINLACDNSKDSITTSMVEGLSVSATTITLLKNDKATVVIGNGIQPYTIDEGANAAVAFALLDGRVVDIRSNAVGTTQIQIKDSSTPAKTVTITITVVETYTTNSSGSMSFNSNRGNFSSNGIGEKTHAQPVSGSGVIALSEFKETLIYGYTVYSPTSIDIVTMYFQGNLSLIAGVYEYPSTSGEVSISYYPNMNPSDSLSVGRGYILATHAIANIETLTSSVVKGTFEGNGYYLDNGIVVSSQTISIDNGKFDVPILKIGKRQENSMEKLILSLGKRSK